MLKRLLLALCFIVAVPAASQAGVWHPTQAAWPDLTTGGWAFAGTRLRPPYILNGSAASNNRYAVYQQQFYTANWAQTAGKLFYQNWYGTSTGPSERLPNSPLRVGGIYVSSDPTFNTNVWRVTFGCPSCYAPQIATGTGQWGDIGGDGLVYNGGTPSAGTFSNTANSPLYVQTYITYNVGDNILSGMFCNLQGSTLSEGSSGVSTPVTMPVVGGVVSRQSNSQCYGPSAYAAKGWDGSSKVWMIGGTSRRWATNLFRLLASQRGNLTDLEQALDSTTGGRASFGILAAPGACASGTSANFAQQFQLRMRYELRGLPNRPYNVWANDFDPNGVNNGCGIPTGVGNATLSGEQSAVLGAIDFQHAECPPCKGFILTGEPWVSTANNFSSWTNTVDQVPIATAAPGALQSQLNAWINSGVGRTFIQGVDLSSVYQSSANSWLWTVPSPAITLTLTSQCTISTRTGCTATVLCNGNASCLAGTNPTLGDNVALDLGNSNLENITLGNVTGNSTSGTQTLTLIPGPSWGKTHGIGATGGFPLTHDGVHEGDTLAALGASYLLTLKPSWTY